MKRMEQIERTLLKKEVPAFRIGDTVRIHLRVKEGEKERIQVFEGVVIGRRGGRNRETFRVRKVSYGVGVERIFPVHSPFVEKIDVVREGKTRRAKLYFLRERKGKAARLSERGMKPGVSKEFSEETQNLASPEPVGVKAKIEN